MPTVFTIAHLSDVHLSPLTGFTPRHWNAKRMLGYVNWQRKRRFVHQRVVADRIVADLKAQRPDHIAVTGDLINVGLPAEYEAAARWLETVGTPSNVSLVPGNHDIYTPIGSEPGIAHWAPYMTSDAWGHEHGGSLTAPQHGKGRGAQGAVGFPYLRRVGPVAVIGLSSAIETAPGVAIGTLGEPQMAAAGGILDRLAAEDVFRLVMIHHPPMPGMTKPHHELSDAEAFTRIVVDAGAGAILHGHTHLATASRLEANGGAIRIIGVGSASAARQLGQAPLAQYNLIDIEGAPGNWSVRLRRRGLQSVAGPVVDLDRETL